MKILSSEINQSGTFKELPQDLSYYRNVSLSEFWRDEQGWVKLYVLMRVGPTELIKARRVLNATPTCQRMPITAVHVVHNNTETLCFERASEFSGYRAGTLF